MELRPETRKALNIWLNGEWHSFHALDKERFFNFIDSYSREYDDPIDEEELRVEIINKVSPGHDISDELDRLLLDRIHLANDILEFLKQNGR